MTRILSLFVGLLIAAAALYVLGGTPAPDVAAGPLHESIDDDSRNKLNGVLRNVDR